MNPSSQKGVIILGNHVQALGIARSLGRKGIPCYLVNDKALCISRFSRYVKKFFTYEKFDDAAGLASFLLSLEKKEKVVAICAPAIASNFENKYLNINGFLKSIGIEAIFDVSFGAELTILSYLDYIEKNNPKTVIAQPCPAIVTYIELYKPELLQYLAPADSPMMHTIKMIKEFYPVYKNHKIVILSPCYAKKREFDEVGIGDFNVTYKSFQEYLNEKNIDLNNFQQIDYDNPSAERAVLFSTPGGLLKTAIRENPDIINLSRKTEGIEEVGIVEVCRGYHVYHAGGVRHACLSAYRSSE